MANPRRLRRYRGRRLWDKADQLQVLDQDWEAACFVEKCPGCFAVAITQREAQADKR